jgi:outer membrane protein assembly factor BamC
MKIVNFFSILLVCLFIGSCSKVTEPVKNINLGNRLIDYQSDDQVDSLIIPPDLTSPSFQGQYSDKVQTEKNESIAQTANNIQVMRDNYRRWLLVELATDEVWTLSKDFFRSYGFKIEKENKQIGIFETDYLEIETVVPEKSLGFIRAALSKALKTQYGLPIADKYRIRVEPTEDLNQTEVYLTLSSIGEVVSGSTRVWQPREKDVELETEMLLKFMIYLGSNRNESVEKINSVNEKTKSTPSIIESSNGFASLVFPYDKKQSWRYLGWALDELSIEIEDRDNFDGSYYVKIPKNKGFFTKLLSTSSNYLTYKLLVKEVEKTTSQVIISELSGQDDQKTIEFSYEFFENILTKF